MLLLLRNNKSCPDSLVNYFAAQDEYRYELYRDLKDLKKDSRFPRQYNNHLDLGKSKMLKARTYDKPDTLVFIDKLTAEIKGQKGLVYFYKYKTKKDDASWKLATVGLVPEDPTQFEFENEDKKENSRYDDYDTYPGVSRYDFTGFRDTKIRGDEPLVKQLNKELKRMLYSRRKSAKEFYSQTDEEESYGANSGGEYEGE